MRSELTQGGSANSNADLKNDLHPLILQERNHDSMAYQLPLRLLNTLVPEKRCEIPLLLAGMSGLSGVEER
jgi:hypothetical protein